MTIDDQNNRGARPASANRDVESLVWLLDRLALEAGGAIDRPRIRRAVDDAVAAWPAGQEDRWWKWVYEATHSLGTRCRVIDCAVPQLQEILLSGGRVILRNQSDGQWKALNGNKGRKVELYVPWDEPEIRRIDLASLRESLELSDQAEPLRCVVIESSSSLITPPVPDHHQDGHHQDGHHQGGHHQGGHHHQGPHHHDEPPPLRRILAVLHAERSDIWIVFVFAAVTGLLGLATPLAVESLVTTVAFGRVLQPVVVVALILFAFLAFSAALQGLQAYVVEIIQRRLFARFVADLSYRLPRVRAEALEGQDPRELVNRFFDIMTVQKTCATLLLDGVSVVLFAGIGMVVLAFYHPWLLGYDVVLLITLAFVILVLGRNAVNTSIKESKTKYRTAAWLEQVVSCPMAFRYWGGAEFALDRADHLTFEYLQARRKHFGILISQIGFSLGLQAVASTVLLGIGGWLVITGQLTLGQLVAAELIVAVIVGAFAKLGKYMELYYDLMAAVDKLGHLLDLPMERQDGLLHRLSDLPASVTISGVTCEGPPGRSGFSDLDLQITAGERLVLEATPSASESLLLDMLFGLRAPQSGHLTLDELDPRDMRPDALRRTVALVRDVEIFAGSIAENIHLGRPEISTHDIRAALQGLGALDAILQMPAGLETELVGGSHTLTPDLERKLMVARATVGRPKLLLIDRTLDPLPDDEIDRIFDYLTDASRPWTLVVASARKSIANTGSRVIRIDGGHGSPRSGGDLDFQGASAASKE